MIDAFKLYVFYSEPILLMLVHGYIALHIVETERFPWMPFIVRKLINIYASIAGFVYFLNTIARFLGYNSMSEAFSNAPQP